LKGKKLDQLLQFEFGLSKNIVYFDLIAHVLSHFLIVSVIIFQRLPFTLVFLGSMIGTIYVSMVLHSYFLSVIFSVVQVTIPCILKIVICSFSLWRVFSAYVGLSISKVFEF
jgi:hypothetical protein